MTRSHARILSRMLAVALIATACRNRDDQASADSDLARDLALVSATPAAPRLSDTALGATAGRLRVKSPTRPQPQRAGRSTKTVTRVPAAPVVVSRNPAPQPAQPEAAATSRGRGFGAGTVMAMTTQSPVCTTNLPGDKFVATLTAPVTGENGAYLPAGTTVVLEVASVTPGDKPETAQLSFRVRSIMINDQPVSTEAEVAILSSLERRQVPRDKGADRRKVVGGAVAGAILGQIMGKDTKSTVIGAAAGAAAGAGAAAMSRKYDACLPAGGTLRVTTSQRITVSD